MKPLFEIRNEYDESLQEFITASMELRQATRLALKMDSDLDPLSTLVEPLARLEKAAHGTTTEVFPDSAVRVL